MQSRSTLEWIRQRRRRPPRMEAYGSADLAESSALMSQLRHLYSGEGIFSKLPLIMEEYGQA